MRIYFDNSATTVCCPEAAQVMMKVLTEDYGNPSSMHRAGLEAEAYVRRASETLAATLKASRQEILFTSGGTESDNLAIFGTAAAHGRKGRHLITSAIEHPAVYEPVSFLEKEGFEVTVLPTDSAGRVAPEDLENAMREDTILVSVMAVNNEVGTIEPYRELGMLAHRYGNALFHVDAVQAYGKLPINPKKDGIDLLSVSSHKFHGPKGVGFLYISNKVRIRPQILGGGQQQGMRSGTDNVPGIAGMAVAAELSCGHMEENFRYLFTLKKRLADGLKDFKDVQINGPAVEDGVPHILNASFLGIRSEVLLHALEDKGIFVSSGSACSMHKRKPSGVLTALGLETDRRESALRFSFSRYNTLQEVDDTLEVLEGLLPVLRRYQRR